MEIQLKIKKLVEQKHFTQEEFARMIGKTKQTVNNYFTGRTKIDVETLEDIAKALSVPVSYFFDQEETSKKIIQNGNNNQIGNANRNSNSSANKELEACLKENELLREQVKDKEKLIRFLEGKK